MTLAPEMRLPMRSRDTALADQAVVRTLLGGARVHLRGLSCLPRKREVRRTADVLDPCSLARNADVADRTTYRDVGARRLKFAVPLSVDVDLVVFRGKGDGAYVAERPVVLQATVRSGTIPRKELLRTYLREMTC